MGWASGEFGQWGAGGRHDQVSLGSGVGVR